MNKEKAPLKPHNTTDCVISEFIPEQFTVKAHPALFEGDGEGQKKIEEHFSQLTQTCYFTSKIPS